MKQGLVLILLMLCTFLAVAQDADENAITSQFIVHLKGNINGNKFFKAYSTINRTKCLSKSMNIWLAYATTDILTPLKVNPSVKVAQYNHQHVKLRSLIPNDSLFNQQWNMYNTAHLGADISATEAWQLNHSNLTRAGDTIVIAVIDGGPYEGFDIYHPDLNFFINHQEIPNNGIDDDGNGYIDDYLGWNVFGNNGAGNDSVYDGSPSDAHPTHVSGIAAAIGNNTIGVAGVCWGVKVLAVCGASDEESDVVEAYDYVLEMRKLYDQTSGAKGALIVATNSSFGVNDYGANPAQYPIWCEMYDSLGKYGILSATAAPDVAVNVDIVNDVPTGCASKWMISVTNTNQTDNIFPQAAFGPGTIDIGAPGTTIVSTVPLNAYGLDFGTSMSCPHITGAVAAMIANACPKLLNDYFAYPDSIALLMKEYIYKSADPLNDLAGSTVTGGRLNLYHAFLAENSYDCNSCNFNDSLIVHGLACYGDSNASLTVYADAGHAPYSYLWSTGDTTVALTNLKTGYYQVTVTDSAGCQRQLSYLLSQPQPITLSSFTIVPISSGSVGNIIVSASAGNDTLYYALDGGSYQAGYGGGTTAVMGATTATFTTGTAGLHHIYIRNKYGCVLDTTVGIYYSGIELVNDIPSISLSPNPASGFTNLTISSNSDYDAEIGINDLAGRKVNSMNTHISNGLQQHQVDLSSLADGVYILTLAKGGRIVASIKMLVIR